MNIVVLKEKEAGESRVALDPSGAERLSKKGFKIFVQKDAGEKSFYLNERYTEAGAQLFDGVISQASIILKIKPPTLEETKTIPQQSILICLLNPWANQLILKEFSEKKITSFALELIPRISRAQSMDVLSSQASLAGYKAVLLASNQLKKFFPMLTTAAGTIAPAKVLVIGAGVAGLQAIATAKRLGAVVEAFDIRPQVKEEIQSLGAKFVEVQLEEQTVAQGGYAKEISEAAKKKTQEVLAQHVKQSDVVITTAQVPGKKAPLLVTETMVSQMKPGSVIVDLASEQGGNCEVTKAGETIEYKGVTILGPLNIPSMVSFHASQMFSKNMVSFLDLLFAKGQSPSVIPAQAGIHFQIDLNDPILGASCVTHGGEIRWKAS